MLSKVPLRRYLYAAAILNLIVILALILLKNFLPPVAPVLYGRPTGESQLLPTLGLTIAPSVSLLIIITNTMIAALSKNSFLKKILVLNSLLASLLTTIAVLKIVFLVGFF